MRARPVLAGQHWVEGCCQRLKSLKSSSIPATFEIYLYTFSLKALFYLLLLRVFSQHHKEQYKSYRHEDMVNSHRILGNLSSDRLSPGYKHGGRRNIHSCRSDASISLVLRFDFMSPPLLTLFHISYGASGCLVSSKGCRGRIRV